MEVEESEVRFQALGLCVRCGHSEVSRAFIRAYWSYCEGVIWQSA
jgi:hypothetical protein